MQHPAMTPPLFTADLPGVGGRIRVRDEDFEVEEVPSYEPCGSGDHLFLWVEKRGMAPEYFARRIAQLPTMTALLIKESVNQSVDNMGFYNSLNACFTLHELNHSHWAQVHENGYPVALEEDGIPNWKSAPPIVPSVKDKVRADS